ncbi:hypothetical protein C8J57DRAFT_1067185, partial [Mycena rebaudengoi]
ATSFLQFLLQYSSLALLYYDFALTLPKEVRYIWSQKFRLSTALYICCRDALVANVLYLLAIAHKLGATVQCTLFFFVSDFQTMCSLCDFWYKMIGTLGIFGRAAVIGPSFLPKKTAIKGVQG